MEMKLTLWREGKFVVVSNEEYGITTQGKNVQEALVNFQDAFLICFNDPDWRRIHSISDEEYKDLLKEERMSLKKTEVDAALGMSALVKKLVSDVKTSYDFWQGIG